MEASFNSIQEVNKGLWHILKVMYHVYKESTAW